jgi:hypothetical protein
MLLSSPQHVCTQLIIVGLQETGVLEEFVCTAALQVLCVLQSYDASCCTLLVLLQKKGCVPTGLQIQRLALLHELQAAALLSGLVVTLLSSAQRALQCSKNAGGQRAEGRGQRAEQGRNKQ